MRYQRNDKTTCPYIATLVTKTDGPLNFYTNPSSTFTTCNTKKILTYEIFIQLVLFLLFLFILLINDYINE